MHKLLIALFGKHYFKWLGRQEVKEEKLIARLDIQVAEDSLKQLEEELQTTGSAIETEQDPQKKQGLRNMMDGLLEQRGQVARKLEENKQKFQNLDYKLHLFNNL